MVWPQARLAPNTGGQRKLWSQAHSLVQQLAVSITAGKQVSPLNHVSDDIRMLTTSHPLKVPVPPTTPT